MELTAIQFNPIVVPSIHFSRCTQYYSPWSRFS